jgi:hypothetical protein
MKNTYEHYRSCKKRLWHPVKPTTAEPLPQAFMIVAFLLAAF